MFHRRSLTHSTRQLKTINQWLGDLAYKGKWLLLMIVLMGLSMTQIPQIFADQLANTARVITTRTGRRYRIINLDQPATTAKTSSQQIKAQSVPTTVTASGSIASGVDILPYIGTGSCIWSLEDMQWTGLQIYTGEYMSGGLLSGDRSLDVFAWTGSWSGFDSQRMILTSTTGIMMHDMLAHSMHYLAMRNCVWSSGVIIYPTDAEYLSGLVMFSGELQNLPILFTGVQLLANSEQGGVNSEQGIIADQLSLSSPTQPKLPGGMGSVQVSDELRGSAGGSMKRDTGIQSDTRGRRVIRSKEEFKQLVDNTTIKPLRQSVKRARDIGAINKLQLTQDITYESDDARIKADIKADTVIFTAQGQELKSDNMVIRKPVVARAPKDSNPPTRNPVAQDVLEFGTPGDHLIFTQPVMITIDADQADGTLVNLSVKHGDDTTFTKQGLSTNPNATCDLDGNTSIPAASATVQGGQIIIYTCGASIFTFTYIGGANFANFIDNGSLSKTVTVDSATVGSVYSIDKLKVIVDFQPIDSEDPTNFGTTNAYSDEVSMTIESPEGTIRTLLATDTYTDTSYADRVVVTFDDDAGSAPSGLPTTGTFLPTQSLDVFDGENPLGDWIFTIGDDANLDGVTLHSVQLEINGIGCGDNIVDIGEQCDDGNTADGDGCSNSCQVETNRVCDGTPSSCSCPNLQLTTTTTGSVTYAPYWGGFNANGSVTNTSAATINSRCINVIGSNYSVTSNFSSVYTASGSDHVFCNAAWNGTIAPTNTVTFGYQGDTGLPAGVQSPSHVSVQGDSVLECLAVCGDGNIGDGEQCDDNNTSPGDGCSASCEIESGYTCMGSPSVCGPAILPSTNQTPIIQSNGGGASTTINLATGQTFVTTVSATDSLENVIGVFGNTTMSGNTIKTLDYGYELCSPAISVSHRQRVNAEIQRVPRITAKGNTGFSVKVDNYNSTIGSIATTLDYVVMNTGAREFDNGLQVQAGTVSVASSAISCNASRNAGIATRTSVTFSPSFTVAPSVLHNVSSYADSSWIISLVNDDTNSRGNEPTTSAMGVSMHRSFNSCTHAGEDVDYIAFEPGHYSFSGFVMDAVRSSDSVNAVSTNGSNVPFTSAFAAVPLTALVAQLGEDGGNGGYAMIHNNLPMTASLLRATIDEDGPSADRNHTNEVVSSVAFSTNTGVFTEDNILTYSITGGPDASDFTINGSGQLSFVDPADTLSANDANTDGTYEVTVSVCDSHCNTKCDTQSIDIVIPESVVPPSGDVCIDSPGSIVMSGVVGGVASIVEYEFDYFSVEDTKSNDDGYYTTLSLGELIGPGGATISTGNIEWRGDSIVVLSGSANPNVVIATGMQTYGLTNTVSTYIKRDTGANSGLTGQYGSSLWIRVNVPAYQTPGTYTSTITYTLYEN